VEQLGALEQAARLRVALRRILTASALVKGTRFAREIPNRWAAWEKLPAAELKTRLERHREERQKVLFRMTGLKIKGQDVGEADRRRLSRLDLELDLGEFEQVLRGYESQPWKGQPNTAASQRGAFRGVSVVFGALLFHAQSERIGQVSDSWPSLPPVRLETLDLVTGDWQAVEQAAAPLLEKRNTVAAGKRKLRKLRELAQVYRLQQRLTESAYFRHEWLVESITSPVDPDSLLQVRARLTQSLLSAGRSLFRARGEILDTWLYFQMLRLELHDDLGLPAR
jgi:hypothetical protein